MATSEACDCHKVLLRASHMGRKWGAAGGCQVGISHCRGHNKCKQQNQGEGRVCGSKLPFLFLGYHILLGKMGL